MLLLELENALYKHVVLPCPERSCCIAAWGGPDQANPSALQQDQLKKRGVKALYQTGSAWAALCNDGTVLAWGNQVEDRTCTWHRTGALITAYAAR